MNRFFLVIVFSFSVIASSSLLLFADESPSPTTLKSKDNRLAVLDAFNQTHASVETVADSIEYSKDQKKIIARGNVVLSYEDTKLTADYAEVQTDSKKAFAKGHIFIFKDDVAVAHGAQVEYDFENDSGSFPDGSIIQPPYYCQGSEIRQVRDGVSEIEHGTVTTCKGSKPPYSIHAKKFTIYEDDKIVAWNVTLKILNKPVFWLPYFVVPLQLQNPPFSIRVGNNTKWGTYILLSKGFSINKHVYGRLHADWRSERGFGTGLDLNYGHEDAVIGEGILKLYWTQDERAPTPHGAFAINEDRDRGRINWKHRKDFDDHTFAIMRYERNADEFFLQDFFEKEFRSDVEPQSFVTLTKNSDKFGSFAHVQKQMNRYESLVERLPQVQFDWKNQQLFESPVYYENQFSVNHMNKRHGRIPRSEHQTRLDMFHEFSAPLHLNQTTLTPFANVRSTYYDRDKLSNDEHFRVVGGYGVDLRTQAYKTYDTEFDQFGIEVNKIRHIVEPSIKVGFQHSTLSDEKLTEFDSVDRIDDSGVITLGLENRLQTKRVINGKMRRVDIVSLNTFVSYELYPDGRSLAGNFASVESGNTSSNFTLWSQEVTLRPYEWLQYEMRTDFDMKQTEFRVFNHDLLAKTKRFNFLFGHRFIKDLGSVEGSNQFVFDAKWAINNLWGVGGYIRWDTKEGEIEEWQLSATRDFECLLLDFGYNVRNSLVTAGDNRELYFNLRLKAFQDMQLKSGARAAFSEPRIGETVAGSNQNRSSSSYHFETL